MIEAYWNIGKRIVEEEQHGKEKADYGSSLIKEFSKELLDEFGKGFSEPNLRNFRQFYLTFANIRYAASSELAKDTETALPQLRKELARTHYRLIMRVENERARR